MAKSYDFSGWATRNNLRCSDGRMIMKDAFKDNDGQTVPLVWNHQHNDPTNVLGHALLENRNEGVYAYCSLNDTELGMQAKQLVQHGDVTALSIYANKLRQQGGNVLHGAIREVSLVLAGANPGAFIDNVLEHADDGADEAVIYTGEGLELSHADESTKEEELKMAENGKEKTVQDVLDELTDEQKKVVYYLIGKAVEDNGGDSEDDEEDEEPVKHNVFDNDNVMASDTLSHSEMETILSDGKRFGSLKESFLAHADEYGITNIEYLFPDAKSLNTPPEFIKREMGWVQKVLGGTHHTPFSRVKSTFANITEDEARAKGYIKGKLKKEEVFSLLKRTTDPQTIYKKQKIDRDDVIDITDFDVVAWLKTEMRMMLDEEIARAILVGDGRLSSDDDKISEDHIRPIVSDADLYTIKKDVAAVANEELPKTIIKAAIKSRKDYRGSGTPTFFTTEDMLADMLLLEDGIGHLLYTSEAQLATTLRVKEIVTVPVMSADIYGIIVNMADYNVGADKGGAINMFDDFDIDYNQQKYLIETRCSGALTKPYSAIVLRKPSGD